MLRKKKVNVELIVVAAISAMGLIVSTWIQTGRHKRIENTLGDRNGNSVVEKLDALIAANREAVSWGNRHEGHHDIITENHKADEKTLNTVRFNCPLFEARERLV